jgi:hypothetical protein
MGIINHLNIGFNINPPLPSGSKILTKVDSSLLRLMGMNIPVEISTATVFQNLQII